MCSYVCSYVCSYMCHRVLFWGGCFIARPTSRGLALRFFSLFFISFEPPCVQRKLVMHTRLGLSEPRIDWTNIVPSQDRDQYELAMRQHADSSADVPDQGCT